MLEPHLQKELSKIYYSPSDSGSYGSVDSLYQNAKKIGLPVTKNEVRVWLLHQSTYTRHKPRLKKFKRRHITRLAVRDTFCFDLIDTIALKSYNNGVQYILSCIDLFSNYAACRTLKNKTSQSTKEGLISIFDELGLCQKAWLDEGSEFNNRMWNELDIHKYHTFSPIKCSVIERYNKTLEHKLFRLMTSRGSLEFVDQLQDVVKGINIKKSRALFGYSPMQIWESKSLQRWLKKQYDKKEDLPLLPRKYKLGDTVRVANPKKLFDRSYKPGFSTEVRKITEVLPFRVPTYKVGGLKASFYEPELSRVFLAADGSQDVKYQYFVKKIRKIEQPSLRSGKLKKSENQFLLADRNRSDISPRWVDEIEIRRLIKDKLLDSEQIPKEHTDT